MNLFKKIKTWIVGGGKSRQQKYDELVAKYPIGRKVDFLEVGARVIGHLKHDYNTTDYGVHLMYIDKSGVLQSLYVSEECLCLVSLERG